jgi:hypothetical protein
MIGPLARRHVAVLAALAAGTITAVAVQSPALADDFSANYTCTGPLIGTSPATIDGTLTATPNPAAAGSPVDFALHIASVSLTAPLPMNSWSITTTMEVNGAETNEFDVTGTGGSVPANTPISGDLAGQFTPSASGDDVVTGGDVTVVTNLFLLGDVTITCTPVEPIPPGVTLTVN